eukprot:8822842-Pyramimonas_sp.AAC.2
MGAMGGHWGARTANVEWCEAVTHGYAHSPYVAEMFNMLSNVFFVMAAMRGLQRARELHLPPAFHTTEALILMVAAGSAGFHATQVKTK